MSAIIIDGKAIGAKIREDAKIRSERLREKAITPTLAVVLLGEDPASLSYVRGKEKALAEARMESRDIRLPATYTEAELLSLIAELNRDVAVHGILVQLPLPGHIREDKIIAAIDPSKDVDGFHPVSVGNMVLGRPGFLPCTPHGVLVLLRELKIPTSGAHAVIVGRSNIVGKPLANLLTRRDVNATVTVCHTGTSDLARFTRDADILIAAAGKAGLVKPDMVKPGAAVIDVGVNRVPDASAKNGYRLTGDVDPGAAERAGYFTPVPGGVGPMTIAMLLQNVVTAAEQIKN
ncbi:MAG: bifunctional 5,10-methylene-tetrahydrofolate dehydrogenase/5,10-methylene-tetrahydrofolate cyclohydrolase [Treponema sp.]|nr:bifunctional 5,10-methylene-tetrahydrofolate dehydrogenase/5,10-methylene-tetrahydrofolate cyclohydrolase [Treponema sp.]